MRGSLARALRRRTALCTLAFAALLAACQSDDGPVIVAAADEWLVERGQTVSLLGNDSIGGVPARADAQGNVSFALVEPAAGFARSADGTSVEVRQDASVGVHDLAYILCDRYQGTRCARGTARLIVTRGPLQAADDDFTLFKGDVANVLDNDTRGAERRPLLPGQDTEVAPVGALPHGLWLSASGEVQVSPAAVPGRHLLDYRVCESGVAANCAQARAAVVVPAYGRIEGTAAEWDLVRAAGLEVMPTPCEHWIFGECGRFRGDFVLEPVPAADRVPLSVEEGPLGRTPLWNWGNVVRYMRYYDGRAVRVEPGQRVRLPSYTPAAFPTGETVYLDQLAQTAAYAGASRGVEVGWSPGALIRADGGVPRFVYAEWAAPRDGAVPADLPGDYTALIDGQPQPIEIFGAALFRLAEGTDGYPDPVFDVDLVAAAGQSLSLRIPVLQGVQPPTTATLFGYDAESARWLPAGPATLRDDGHGGLQYDAQTVRGGIWAVGRLMQPLTLRGCVVDEHARPVPGAVVMASGREPWTWSRTQADAAGRYTLTVPRQARVTLAALRAGAQDSDTPVSTRELSPLDRDTDLTPCLEGLNPPPLVLDFVTYDLCHDVGCMSPMSTVLLAPDGTDLVAGRVTRSTSWPIQRLQVGTYRLFSSLATVGDGHLDATRPVTVTQPGMAPRTYRLPGPAPAGAEEGYWRLVEIDVDSACRVNVRARMERVIDLPAAVNVAAEYCRP